MNELAERFQVCNLEVSESGLEVEKGLGYKERRVNMSVHPLQSSDLVLPCQLLSSNVGPLAVSLSVLLHACSNYY